MGRPVLVLIILIGCAAGIFFLYSCDGGGSSGGACIPSGDQEDINAALLETGDVAMLCAGAVFELTSPVVFTADGQQVYTQDHPTDDRRAVLRVVSVSNPSAVTMRDRSDAVLSNVIVDGNRPNLGPRSGEALIYAGGGLQVR